MESAQQKTELAEAERSEAERAEATAVAVLAIAESPRRRAEGQPQGAEERGRPEEFSYNLYK